MDKTDLQKLKLFADLPEEELDRIAGEARDRDLPEGELVVQAGTWPYHLIGIAEGTAEVRADGETKATLGAGDLVGETGLLNRGLRNADVVATSNVRLITFSHYLIKDLRKRAPEFDARLNELQEQRT